MSDTQRDYRDLSLAPRSYRFRQLVSTAVPKEGDEDGLRNFITDRFQAPIELFPAHPQDTFDNEWLSFVAKNYEVDGEASAFVRDDDEDVVDIYGTYDMLRNLEIVNREVAWNCAQWYETASEQFVAEVIGPCLLAPMVTEKDRIKHHPRTGSTSSEDLRRRSELNGESIFEFGIDTGVLSLLTRSVEQEILVKLLGVHHLRAFVECMCVVGYTNGHPTSVIAIEWSSTGVHCYPDTIEVFRSQRAIGGVSVFDDILQGYAAPRN